MALAISQDDIFVNIVFSDEADDETTRRIQLKWDTDLATTLQNGVDHAALWDALTKAAIPEISFSIKYRDAVAAFDAGAENQEVAHIGLKLTQNPPLGLSKGATLEIPAPVDAIREALNGPQKNEVDTTHADLLGLYADFTAAGDVYISHGQYAEAIKAAYIHHQDSKKG